MRTPAAGRVALAGLVAVLVIDGGTLAASERDDAIKALTGQIDARIETAWQQSSTKPAPPVDDAIFLRRVYLDLVGRVPSLTDARDFLDDTDPRKRRDLVRRLMKTDDYARHTALVWGRQLFPVIPNSPVDRNAAVAWLRQQIKEGVGHDQLVRELVAVPRPAAGNRVNPATLFTDANQSSPASVAAATSRVFLGVKIECAQCHNHPFAAWKREQFWELAAFFSGIQDPNQMPQRPLPKEPGREIAIPETSKVVRARFLDGTMPKFKDDDEGRTVLAEWIVRRDNPYFAKAAVNRVWARYLGTGIVDPPDEMAGENPASHPELLDDLAAGFAANGFDERFVTEAILLSKVYQLGSTATDRSQADARRFARFVVRGLSAEQVYDSLLEVTGRGAGGRPGNAALAGGRDEFLARFSTPDRPTQAQTPILQALHVMNGPLVAAATKPENNRALRVLAESAADHPERCVEELYLAVLTRTPAETERDRFVEYVRTGGPHKDTKRAVADVFWVLLNSTEFVVNH